MNHPDQTDIERNGKGPAIIEYKDGIVHGTENLAYTTCLKYVTIGGGAFTTKGSSIRRIRWLNDAPTEKDVHSYAYS